MAKFILEKKKMHSNILSVVVEATGVSSFVLAISLSVVNKITDGAVDNVMLLYSSIIGGVYVTIKTIHTIKESSQKIRKLRLENDTKEYELNKLKNEKNNTR